jgi:hypothetical protein
VVHLGEPLEPTPQQLNLRRGCPFLPSEDLGSIDELRSDIAGDPDVDSPESLQRVEGAQRSETTIGRCRPSHPNEYLLRTGVNCGSEQFAGSIGRGCNGITRILGYQRQARCLRHLDDRPATRKSPPCLNGVTQRSGRPGRAISATHSLEEPLTTIGNRHHMTCPTGRLHRRNNRSANFSGGGSPPKLVGSDDDVHPTCLPDPLDCGP